MKQKTFLMLKPDAFAGGHAQEVLRELRSHGLVIEKSCTLTVTMGVMKTLIDHYAGVIDSMSKDFNFPGKLFNSFYYDGPHTIMPMEVSYEGVTILSRLHGHLQGKPIRRMPVQIRSAGNTAMTAMKRHLQLYAW